MRFYLVLFSLSFLAINAKAQNDEELPSIEDIAAQEQVFTMQKQDTEHFKKVWGRKGYFNIALASGGQSLSPLNEIPTSIAGEFVADKDSKFGASITLGKNIALHTPIANIVRMNIDIEGTLAGNYFEKVNGGFYNSDLKNAKNSFLMPWNADIYHGSFQMAVGPSVTVAPFSPLSEKGLHFIKLNIYWHVGYQGSVLYFNESKSKNQQTLKSTDDINSFEHATKLMLGHGLTSTIGLNLSYKAIGLGYEYWRTMRPVEYESMDSKILDGEKNRFKEHVNRIYIQFRL